MEPEANEEDDQEEGDDENEVERNLRMMEDELIQHTNQIIQLTERIEAGDFLRQPPQPQIREEHPPQIP